MKNILSILFVAAALILPTTAMAAEAPAAPSVECTPAAAASTVADLPASPLFDAQAVMTPPQCCTAMQTACEARCRATGVFEFNCDSATCNSTCICNIG